MGIGQRKSKGNKGGHKTKNKQFKKSHCTANRSMDVDQIQDNLEKEQELGRKTDFEFDDDLPGGGQFYCTPCARHFMDQDNLDKHTKSKIHKRRMKDVAQEKYTQAEADAGAGKSKEVYAPAHPDRAAELAATAAAAAAV
jgi:Zinc-finger double-stranded RNA-binding